MKQGVVIVLCIVVSFSNTFCQEIEKDSIQAKKEILDSIYIAETENVKGKDKVLHAEPLFIDLIRDLGARKGEREWNIGVGMTDEKHSTITVH